MNSELVRMQIETIEMHLRQLKEAIGLGEARDPNSNYLGLDISSDEVRRFSSKASNISCPFSFLEVLKITSPGEPKQGAILFEYALDEEAIIQSVDTETGQIRSMTQEVWIPKAMLSNLDLVNSTIRVYCKYNDIDKLGIKKEEIARAKNFFLTKEPLLNQAREQGLLNPESVHSSYVPQPASVKDNRYDEFDDDIPF